MARRARWTLIISVLVTVGLFVVPYGHTVAYPLLLISTLVHELGHGVAALLVGGDFHEFKMWWNGSGVAMHSGADGAFARSFTAAGGLVGPALCAAILFVLARRTSTARLGLAGFGAALTVALVFVVRNGFGLAFVGILAALALFIALRGSASLVQATVVFLAVQLALSVYARSDYLFTEWADTTQGRMPSDVKQMEMALALPYWVWGGLCTALSIAALAIGGYYFLRSGRGKVRVTPRAQDTLRI